jgi:hypothetical protein
MFDRMAGWQRSQAPKSCWFTRWNSSTEAVTSFRFTGRGDVSADETSTDVDYAAFGTRFKASRCAAELVPQV